MIRSMTGFGGASVRADGVNYVVEARSVNNRYFKTLIRLPEDLQGLEPELEAALSKRLNRGSVTMIVRFTDNSGNAAARINPLAVQRYLEQLREVPDFDHESATIDLGALMGLPGVVVADSGEERMERARSVLVGLVEEACAKVLAMRAREGQTLHADLEQHCELITEQLAVIRERAPIVVELYRERLRQRMNALLAESGTAVRDEDLVREVAVFAERSDLAEEVSRLQGHLEHFREIIDATEAKPVGRTLEFLTQEMLREANTIAGKSLDAQISRRIVEIKGAIDRIKEQVQNVE